MAKGGKKRLPAPHRLAVSSVATLLAQAKALHTTGRLDDAGRAFKAVLQRAPTHFEAAHMLGVIALQTGDAERAVALIEQALRISPAHARAHANLGTGYSCLNRPEEALRAYERALEIDPALAGVLRNRGTILQHLGRFEEAAESFQRLCELAPQFDFAPGSLFEARRYGFDWRNFQTQADAVAAGIAAGRNADRPFSFLSVSGSAELQYQCARLHAAYLCPRAELPLWKGERYRHEKIRIAYLSADFRDHVVLRLLTPILELHDRQRFHTIGISLAAADNNDVVKRATGALARFIDGSRLNDQAVAKAMRSLEVDIAIDLTGYTSGCRPGIFAHRPAPVQVNYFGFPGTTGASFMDYIIGDDFVAPECSAAFFSERIVRLPDSFHPGGPRGQLTAAVPACSRSDEGLPERCIVLCAFHNTYKINPECFDIWARVMHAVPDSVLWVLGESGAQRRLQHEAVARGLEPKRLVFARRVPYEEHLRRLRVADLFLDTWPFNAGATAADALWAGVPLLTCAGEAFASRMAGSVLRAVGLPELITYSCGDYERRATELASDHERLGKLKSRLAANLHTHPMYDGPRYCRHLESAYTQMWERVQRGEVAASFDVRPAHDNQQASA
jgi:predicted O-linked N-acetylglucosamine transferase (SPINDLY family)